MIKALRTDLAFLAKWYLSFYSMKDSSRLLAALQDNSSKLLEENFLEAMAYRASDRPLKLTVQHVIDFSNGAYKIRTVLGFGIRVSHRLEAALATEEKKSIPVASDRGAIGLVAA